MVGDDVTELAEDVLPNSLCVEWSCPVPSQNGQSARCRSQPSRRSFSGQLWRLLAGLHCRMSSYHRCAQVRVVRLRPAMHMFVSVYVFVCKSAPIIWYGTVWYGMVVVLVRAT